MFICYNELQNLRMDDFFPLCVQVAFGLLSLTTVLQTKKWLSVLIKSHHGCRSWHIVIFTTIRLCGDCALVTVYQWFLLHLKTLLMAPPAQSSHQMSMQLNLPIYVEGDYSNERNQGNGD